MKPQLLQGRLGGGTLCASTPPILQRSHQALVSSSSLRLRSASMCDAETVLVGFWFGLGVLFAVAPLSFVLILRIYFHGGARNFGARNFSARRDGVGAASSGRVAASPAGAWAFVEGVVGDDAASLAPPAEELKAPDPTTVPQTSLGTVVAGAAETAPADEKLGETWRRLCTRIVLEKCRQDIWPVGQEMLAALQMQQFFKCYDDNLGVQGHTLAGSIEKVRAWEKDRFETSAKGRLRTSGFAYLALESLLRKTDREKCESDACRFVRDALTWRCLRVLGEKVNDRTFIRTLDEVLQGRVANDATTTSQFLKSYKEVMGGMGFPSRTVLKTVEGARRRQRGRDRLTAERTDRMKLVYGSCACGMVHGVPAPVLGMCCPPAEPWYVVPVSERRNLCGWQ